MKTTQSFTSFATKSEYKIMQDVNCKTINTVYIINCPVCNLQYTGETNQKFSYRMNGHRSDLTLKPYLPLSKHFVSAGHNLDDFERASIQIIECNTKWTTKERQQRESYWIQELQTLHPQGINKKE